MLSCSQLWERAVSNQCCICWILKIRLDFPSFFLYQLAITKLSWCVYFSQAFPCHCRRPLGFYLQCQVLSAGSCPADRGHHQVSHLGILLPYSPKYGIEVFHIWVVFPSFSKEIRCLHLLEGFWFAFRGCEDAPTRHWSPCVKQCHL